MKLKTVLISCGVLAGVSWWGWHMLSHTAGQRVMQSPVTPHTTGLDAYYQRMREQLQYSRTHMAPTKDRHIQERMANDARIHAQWQAQHLPEQKKLEQHLKVDPEFARQYAEDEKKREAAIEYLAARRFAKQKH